MNHNYILITPAYNEQDHLLNLAESILKQSLMPFLWVIVDDDSKDNTRKILEKLCIEHNFIRAVYNKKDAATKNYYAHKIHAFNKGYEYLKSLNIEYEFIGNLDADITLSNDYYQNIINEFANNPKLGIAGGSYRYPDPTKVIWGGNYVPGSILMARRQCFDEAGGYKPLKYGAEDTLLCIEAEMSGWEVCYFPQYQVVQNRKVGSVTSESSFKIKFRQGLSDQKIGYSSLYQIAKCVNRTFKEKPYILASLYRLSGYFSGIFTNESDKYVSHEVKAFLKKKQLKKLMRIP